MRWIDFMLLCSDTFRLQLQESAARCYLMTNTSHNNHQPMDDWIWALTMGGEIDA